MEHTNQNFEYSTNLGASCTGHFSNVDDADNHFCERLILSKINRPLSGNNFDEEKMLIAPCNSKQNGYEKYDYNTSDGNENDEENSEQEDNYDKTAQETTEMEQSGNALLSNADNTDNPSEHSIKNMVITTPKEKDGRDVSAKLKAELSKYKQELLEYTNTTKDLEEKYLKINHELSKMQEKHDHFVLQRKSSSNATEVCSDVPSTGSEYSLRRKYTQVFHHSNEYVGVDSNKSPKEEYMVQKYKFQENRRCRSNIAMGGTRENLRADIINRRKRRVTIENKENEPPDTTDISSDYKNLHVQGLKDIYKVLKNAIKSNENKNGTNNTSNCTDNNGNSSNDMFLSGPSNKNSRSDVNHLHSTIVSLQSEQERYRTIIKQQHCCLQDYHTRCLKAHQIMQNQQVEIEKLNSNNRQLESEITNSIDKLRIKIETKLRKVSQLPQMMRDEQSKHEKVIKENTILCDRIRSIQSEANQLKIKIEDIGKRKMATLTRLKAAERDLKIFKNYNAALKHEKCKLTDELNKAREQMEALQNLSKRSINRQREQGDKQRGELQKRVFELEMKLSRNQSSTSTLIQERDSLISELQSQLNTLVHNFEVSQKHIRVLRRHIYTMNGQNSNGPRVPPTIPGIV